MIIQSVRVDNFRSIKGETLHCSDLTALVGRGGAGKSAFLHAVSVFYSLSPKINEDDFYDRDTAAEISIEITYSGLNAEAKELFAKYLDGDTLSITKIIKWVDGKPQITTHGTVLQHPAFQPIKDALGQTRQTAVAKKFFDEARAKREYSDLAAATTKESRAEALRAWESAHPEQCEKLPDNGQFFGFKEVGQGHLRRFTRFLFITAVREAADDAEEGRNSVLSELMDIMVRASLANQAAIKEFKAQTLETYKGLLDPAAVPALQELAIKMTTTLQSFAPEAAVDLKWKPLPDVLEMPLPQADAKIVQDGYTSPVGNAGHGLQRAFIMTALQYLAVAQARVAGGAPAAEGGASAESLPDFVLAIEEPELYQHPSSQRHLAKLLVQLASGATPGVAEKTQILYCTHSPLLVGIDRLNQLRLLKKVVVTVGQPKAAKIVMTTTDKIAEELWIASERPGAQFTGLTLLPRLQAIMTPWMNEGFFADVAVLVEGEEDRAAILGMALNVGHDLESEGFVVIPCFGKNNIDRPAIIFKQFGIPTYPVWDGDFGNSNPQVKANRRLLGICGQTPEDQPDTKIETGFACLKTTMTDLLKSEIGASNYSGYLQQAQDELGYPERDFALKSPAVVKRLIELAKAGGHPVTTLATIVEKVLARKGA